MPIDAVDDDMTESWLRQLGNQTLARLPDIVAEANESIARALPSYPQLIPSRDLRDSGRNIIGTVLRRLAGLEPNGSVSIAVDSGRRRQAQGVALEDVLRAVRMDFKVLWAVLVEESAKTPDPAAVSALAMLRVWTYLDEIMVAIADGYRHAEALIDRDRLARRVKTVSALAFDPDPDPALIAVASEVLEIPPDAKLLVAAGRLGAGSDYRLETRWRSLGVAAYVGPLGEDMVGITVWSRLARRVLEEMVQGNPDHRAVIAPQVNGIRGLYKGIAIARTAVPGSVAGQVSDSRDLLVESALAGSQVVSSTLSAVILADLMALPEYERARLLETMHGWMSTDGSTADVARKLNRHRNTVINHLRRISELTHLSLTSPSDVATLVAAIKAYHLQLGSALTKGASGERATA